MSTLLGKIKLWQKIALIIGSFSLPLVILAIFTFQSFNESIALARLEKTGLQFARPLTDLMRDMCAHQLLIKRIRSGEKGLEPEILGCQTKIDDSFDAIERAMRRSGEVLKMTAAGLDSRGRSQARLELVRAQWQALKAQTAQISAADSERQHEELEGHIKTLISHVADNSDLELDPALDTFFLMDGCIRTMPEIQIQMKQIVEHGLDDIEQKSLENHAEIAGKIALFREDYLPRLIHDVESALREDANYFGVNESLQRDIPPRLEEVKKTGTALLALADHISRGERNVEPSAMIEAGTRMAAAQDQLTQGMIHEIDQMIQERIDHFVWLRLRAILLSAGTVLLASGLAWAVVRNTTVRLSRLAEAARSTAMEGDLSHEIETGGTDEIGVLSEAFSQMVSHLRMLAGQVQKAALVMNASVSEIAATSKQQQATTSEVAATTTEIGATSKEIYNTSKELVKTVNSVAEVAEETATLANNGQSSLGRMQETMGLFTEAVSSISAKLAVLNDKAGNINQVITTITKVADQTNLLSLNAAIEAEKAGEQGRGFSVVAIEIRRLADQTAVATYDIEQMVKEMQSAVATGVMGVEKFSEQVRHGVQEVQQVSVQLGQIIRQVQTLSPRFVTVNEGMQAQAASADQINQALLQLSEATRQTADSLRQSNASIDQLHDAARGMLTSLNGFKLHAA